MPYSSRLNPLTFALRKGKIALTCLDARRVNKWLLTDRSSAPPINESLQKFIGSRFVTTTDLSSTFLQIGSQDESRKYTEFLFECQVYQFTRTLRGFRNSLAVFMRVLQTILGPDTCDCTVAYVYDKVVHSTTLELHLEHLDAVLRRLRSASFTVSAEKCHFCRKVQASLVIRDLTLRVFVITRFRKKKSREKIVQ